MRTVAPIAMATLMLCAMIFMNSIMGDFNPSRKVKAKRDNWVTRAVLNQEPLIKCRGAR